MTPIGTRETTEKIEVATKNVRITKLKKAKRTGNGMFDVPEIVALSLSGSCLIAVILCYFFGLVPAREDLKQRNATRDKLDAQLRQLQTKLGDSRSTESGVADLVGSVERFENNFLTLPTNGNAGLYSRLNELIRSNNLRNTAGPDYSPLETIDPRRAASQSDNTGRARLQSLFPGTAVSVTVEGGYSNLRHFIRDLENSGQFIVINAIEIESSGEGNKVAPAQNNQSAQSPQTPKTPNAQTNPTLNNPTQMMPNDFSNPVPNNAQGQKVFPRDNKVIAPRVNPTTPTNVTPKSRGSVVSLRLQLATYFRRTAPIN